MNNGDTGQGSRLANKGNSDKPVILNVDRTNVDQTGFFCLMSRRRSEGHGGKLSWVKARFDEGLRIKMLKLPERGFIEYIPGEFAWRAIEAKGWMVIHCLWVVGKSKGKGFGGILLEECVKDAKKSGMRGVAMVTSQGNWLAGQKLLESHGFKAVDTAPPSFTLMVKALKPGPLPSFPDDLADRAARFGKGLTILTSGQCPYHSDATRILKAAAAKAKIKMRVVELKTARQAQTLSPSPYGVFQVVLDGKLMTYHYLTEDGALELLARRT
ncbi:MAG: GNAT family N-acetyltransferase [Candidatus Aminicenantales bacterium]